MTYAPSVMVLVDENGYAAGEASQTRMAVIEAFGLPLTSYLVDVGPATPAMIMKAVNDNVPRAPPGVLVAQPPRRAAAVPAAGPGAWRWRPRLSDQACELALLLAAALRWG